MDLELWNLGKAGWILDGGLWVFTCPRHLDKVSLIKQLTESIGSEPEHNMRGGRRSKIAFTMRRYGFLLIFIRWQSSGWIGWDLHCSLSFPDMQHMHHAKLIPGRSSLLVQRRHSLLLHRLLWKLFSTHKMSVTLSIKRSKNLSGHLSGILSGSLSGILSGSLSGIYPGNESGNEFENRCRNIFGQHSNRLGE